MLETVYQVHEILPLLNSSSSGWWSTPSTWCYSPSGWQLFRWRNSSSVGYSSSFVWWSSYSKESGWWSPCFKWRLSSSKHSEWQQPSSEWWSPSYIWSYSPPEWQSFIWHDSPSTGYSSSLKWWISYSKDSGWWSPSFKWQLSYSGWEQPSDE